MMFVIASLAWVLSSYLAYKIGFRSAAEASASLLVKFMEVMVEQEKEIELLKNPPN